MKNISLFAAMLVVMFAHSSIASAQEYSASVPIPLTNSELTVGVDFSTMSMWMAVDEPNLADEAKEIHKKIKRPKDRGACTVIVATITVNGETVKVITCNPGATGGTPVNPPAPFPKRPNGWPSPTETRDPLVNTHGVDVDENGNPVLEDTDNNGVIVVTTPTLGPFEKPSANDPWPHAEDVIDKVRDILVVKHTPDGGAAPESVVKVGICNKNDSSGHSMCGVCQGKYGDDFEVITPTVEEEEEEESTEEESTDSTTTD
jgi:hypothetical protein